jgi:hypothetical protein
MNKDLVFSIGMFIFVGTGSLLSRLFHWYDFYWFADIALHTLSGIGFGFLWLFLDKRKDAGFAVMLGAVSFGAFGSLLWEYGELGAWKFLPFYAPFYSPNFFDTIGDITCGLVGGLISTLALFFRK